MKYEINFKEEGQRSDKYGFLESYFLPRAGDRLYAYKMSDKSFRLEPFWAEVIRVEWNDLGEGSVTLVVKAVEK